MASPVRFDDVRATLATFPKRQGVRNRDWFFGRREELASMLDGTFAGPELGSVWIHGPRRIGKTSLSQAAMELVNVEVVWLTATPGEIGSADDLLRAVLAKLRVEPGDARPGARLRVEIEGRDERPILVVVDEFDTLALTLTRDEQALLRSLADDVQHPGFGWLFVTRAAPDTLCRRFDDQSWLNLICSKLHLGFMSRTDVELLTEQFVARCRVDLPWRDLATLIFERVAGYSVAVTALLAQMAARWLCGDGHTIEVLERILDRELRDHVRDDLTSIWSDLPLEARLGFLDRDRRFVDDVRRFGLCDEGDDVVAAIWLREAAAQLGIVPSGDRAPNLFGLAERLNDLMFRCTDLSARTGGRSLFEVGHRAFRMYEIARPARAQSELRSVVNLLHQTICEGSPKDPATQCEGVRKTAALTLRATRGFKDLQVARNFEGHEPAVRRSPAETSRVYGSVGEVWLRYTGRPAPRAGPDEAEDCEAFHTRLLGELVQSLGETYEVLVAATTKA